MAPKISMEDSCPQAILEFHCPSSLDYRAHQGLKVRWKFNLHLIYEILKPSYLNFVSNFQIEKRRLTHHWIFVIWFMILIIKWGNFIAI